MSLAANALTTLTVLQSVTGLSGVGTALGERLINSASAYLERMIGRKLYREASIAEKLAGYGDPYLVVTRTPINAIASISYAGTTVSADDYEIHDAEAGTIYFANGTTWTAPEVGGAISSIAVAGMERRRYTVTYDGGWITRPQNASPNLPVDIEEACLQLATSLYRKDGADQSVKSESILSVSVTYRDGGIPQMVRDVIDSYRRSM